MALILEKIQLEDPQNFWQENSRSLFYWCAYGIYIYSSLQNLKIAFEFEHK